MKMLDCVLSVILRFVSTVKITVVGNVLIRKEVNNFLVLVSDLAKPKVKVKEN